MAGTVPTINPNTITGIRGLESRPVYFLRLNGQAAETLVVKGDKDGAEVSIKWGSKLMKNVNNQLVNTKVMTATEITEFRRAVTAVYPVNSRQRLNATDPNARYTWVKMPMVAGLSDAGFMESRDTIKGSDLKATIVKFMDEEVWSDLGKVVAVDLFNANNDRFQVLSGDGSPLGTWNNKGNVMFVAAGPTKVIGLDTFDPASDRSDLTAAGHYDDLRILIDQARREAFATACVKSVGSELKKTFRFSDQKHVASLTVNVPGQGLLLIKLDQLQDLYLPYRDDFAGGIAAGAAQLRAYLQQKVRQYNPVPWQRAVPRAPQLPPPPPPPVLHGPMPAIVGPLPPPPAVPGAAAPARGQWVRGAPRMPPPPVPAAPAPGGWVRAAPRVLPPPPAAAAPPPAAAAGPVKTIPQGILDRMAFLGW